MSLVIRDTYLLLYTTDIPAEFFIKRNDISEAMVEELLAKKMVEDIYASKNPNITEKFITGHKNIAWNYTFLSANKNITPEFAAKSKMRWYRPHLMMNPHFLQQTLQQIDTFMERHRPYLSRNTALTWEIVEKYNKIPWNWKELSRQLRLTRKDLDIIAQSGPLISHIDWGLLSRRKELGWKLISSHLNLPWKFTYISRIIPWGYIEKFSTEHTLSELHRTFNWMVLSQMGRVNWQYVVSHPNFPWHLPSLLMNKNIINYEILKTEEAKKLFKGLSQFYARNLSCNSAFPLEATLKLKKPDYEMIALRRDITLDFIKRVHTPSLGWDNNLSLNRVITEEIIKACPEINWDLRRVCSNPKISVAFILEKFGTYHYTILRRINLTYKDVILLWNTRKTAVFREEGNIDVWFRSIKFDYSKRAALVIQRIWRRYKYRKIKKEIHKELSLVPPTENGGFLGGEEYRKSLQRFSNKMQANKEFLLPLWD